MSYPRREEAHRILAESLGMNPGPWGDHCRTAAHCAQKIAAAVGLDPERAYVLGLLHDIGRRFGKGHLAHAYDGWKYMLELGYDAAARICLTHSFSVPTLECYIGNRDIPAEAQGEMEEALSKIIYDDYDKLIQLCDCLAGAGEVMDMEARMADVKARYGNYPQEKWDANMTLKAYFEAKAGRDIYDIVK